MSIQNKLLRIINLLQLLRAKENMTIEEIETLAAIEKLAREMTIDLKNSGIS